MAGASIFANRTAPNVFLSWGGHPGYIPPPQFSPNQTTFCTGKPEKGPRYDAQQHAIHGWTQNPAPALIDALRASERPVDPDLIVIATDVFKTNKIPGLDAFSCPKLLVVGDTHHGPRPLEAIIAYAQSQAFDAIAIQFDRHHAHWFRTAGFERLAWAPGLAAHYCESTEPSFRPGIVTIAGQIGPIFPRRTRMLQALQDSKLPFYRFEVRRVMLEQMLRASPITFNCSLNGDLNLRIFEAVSAGSLLVTDRLSEESGIDALFEPGRECATYETEAELIDLCRHFLERPKEAEAIADRARQRMAATAGYDRQAEKLAAWVLGEAPPPFEIGTDPRTEASRAHAGSIAERLKVYQAAQLVHAERTMVRTFVGAGCPAIAALDLVDLPRLQLVVDAGRRDVLALLDEHGHAGRFVVTEDAMASADWDLWLDRRPRGGAPATLAQGTVEPLTDDASGSHALNLESLAKYKRHSAVHENRTSLQHTITSIGGPHGQLNLVMRKSVDTAAMVKRVFEERLYAPYPALSRARFIVDIGTDEGLVAAQFRLLYPDATILCIEEDGEMLRLLTANAAAIGHCQVFEAGLRGDDAPPPGLVEAIRTAARATDTDGPDIVRIGVADNAAAIAITLAPLYATTKSFFVATRSDADRKTIGRLFAGTHLLWRNQLGTDTSGLLRFIRNDLAGAANPA